MSKQRKSTTPIADEKHARYAGMYAKDKHVECNRDEFDAARCDICGSRFSYLMSEYAMWYGSNDHAMICKSGHVCWFHIVPVKGKGR